ncbi:MAG: hypothetical protein Q9227_009401 [Pyrenula ochraceoflavens]
MSDPAFDRRSIELSVRSSQISQLAPVRVKRRLQDAIDRVEGLVEDQQRRSDFAQAHRHTVRDNHQNDASRDRLVQGDPPERAQLHHTQDPNERTSLLASLPSKWWEEQAVLRSSYTSLRLLWVILESNYAHVFLLLVPFGILGHSLRWPAGVLLALNGLSMLPLTLLIALGTEELGANLGESVSGVLNYSFGNAGTIIISCILLKRGEVLVVQTSLLGAIVFNLLAVVGFQFIAGGVRYREQQFNSTVASVNASMLLLSVGTLFFPAILNQVQGIDSVIIVSRQLAVSSILIYLCFLVFQFRTHAAFWDHEVEYTDSDIAERSDSEPQFLAPIPAFLLMLAATTGLTAVTEYFINALDDVSNHHGISRTFIGFIFLPLFSNAFSHVTEVGDAWKNKLDKASNLAIGCSIQIALFIIPASILVGWVIRTDMTLNFDVYLSASAFMAVLLLNSVTQNGKSNFMEGLLLVNCYLGIAVGAYFYPAGVGDGKGK